MATIAQTMREIEDEAREDARFGTYWNPYVEGGAEYKAYDAAYNAPTRIKLSQAWHFAGQTV